MEDPTKISEKQEKKVKAYCKDFFDKAVAKRRAHEKKKAGKKQHDKRPKEGGTPAGSPPSALDASPNLKKESDSEDDGDVKMSEDEDEDENISKESPPISPGRGETNGDSLKRKRELNGGTDGEDIEGSITPIKKLKSQSPPPPPPPPPPADASANASVDVSPQETNEHDEGAFTSKTMADVLASAQQDTADDAEAMVENSPDEPYYQNSTRNTINGFHANNPSVTHLPPEVTSLDLQHQANHDGHEQLKRDSRAENGIETGDG